MAEFKLGYKYYPKDLAKFKPIDKDDDLTNLRFGNDTLIEIGRTDDQFDRTLDMVVKLVGCVGGGLIFYSGLSLFQNINPYRIYSGISCSLGLIILSLLTFWLFLSQLTKVIIWPADYPVRFNRKTGKVYVYEPMLSKRLYYFPLREIRKLYKPVIKVYDWQSIDGMVSRHGFFFQQEIFAAVIDRQTDTLIDYFSLWDNANYVHKSEWRWLLCYMNGMEGMNYKGKIRGRFWLGRLFNCFAPEFNWPEGIDKASRAESLEELAKIEQEYDLVGKSFPYEQP
ncbi:MULTISPECIES: DUF6708 domain-containing protein [Gilliamella]|uniref:DUF6708 domain-containing protein n=1 Tax=Gilliamella apicola TaxID=1196095 RepID=A0A556SAB8_9GAMM|nr:MULTISPECIES: DUF6708 domain-containing protein [Gilliamella]MBI0095780.1 hypothetical protein [Gilliamella sp. W8136]TSJ98064.1 hypothetical protein FPQ15_10360 [Gilliamella apicola]